METKTHHYKKIIREVTYIMKKRLAMLITTGLIAGAMAFGAYAEEAFDFGQLADQEFYFSSGVGGWFDCLEIAEDGSFTGQYHDSEMGDMGEDYPNGTVYGCLYHGQFELGEQLSETAYQLKVASCEKDEGQLDETIEDGVRYVTSDPAGIKEGDELVLYLPGQSVEDFSEEMRFWLHLEDPENTKELTTFALLNEKDDIGFVSSPKLLNAENPWTDTDADGMMQELGLFMGAPEGAEDVIYRVLAAEQLGEIQFTLDGQAYTARIKAAAEEEDISGLYFDWTSEEECEIEGRKGTIRQAQDEDAVVIACSWFDVAPGIMYSVSTSTQDPAAVDITAVAEAVFEPMQE